MSYRTCYLCKFWSEDSGWCSKNNTVKKQSDWCARIELIPCCASCRNWSKNDDYIDEGNCRIYRGLTPAGSICREEYYEK